MTPVKSIQKTCFICKKASKQKRRNQQVHPGNPGSSGIMDLEGRPKELNGEMLRSLIEVCPHCGYVARDIGEAAQVTENDLQSPGYRSLIDPEKPLLPYLFLRAAVLIRDTHPEKAIELYLSAAWSADSIPDPELAFQCRKEVVSLIFAEGKTFADIPSSQWIRILDTMRRCSDFEAVIAHCTSLLPIAGGTLRQGLEYELSCAKQGDNSPRTTLDLVKKYRSRSGSEEPDEEFIIGGRSYSIGDNCHGPGWNWEAETRTLALSNYQGTAIDAPGDISILITEPDNSINSTHGPGIHIRQGDLKMSGRGILNIRGDDYGIFVESGVLEVVMTALIIRTTKAGIHASGSVFFDEGSVLDNRSETTGIISEFGGLKVYGGSVLKIHALYAGIDLSGDMETIAGLYQIESPEGCGILIHHGSLTFSDNALDIISKDTCIRIDNGDLFFKSNKASLIGHAGILVNGSAALIKSNSSITGEVTGLSVTGDLDFSGGRCECSGEIGLSAGGDLHIRNTHITISGGTGITIGGNLDYSQGTLMVTGDMAFVVSGNAVISEGIVVGVGRIRGMVVQGSYNQSAGDISLSGEAQEGLLVAGDEMNVANGLLTVSGRKCGLDVRGDIVLENISLSASGNIGFSAGKSLSIDRGVVKIAGEEIGLSMKGGDLVIGQTVSISITGNAGIYTNGDIEIRGGDVQVTGQFGGLVLETGDLKIISGVVEISADDCGVLLVSGSMDVSSGIITITNSRMMDTGGIGVDIRKGDLVTTSLMKVKGESYGISVPCGEVSVKFGSLIVSGYHAGIAGRSISLESAVLTAYGKLEGALLLSGSPWNDPNARIQAGMSKRTAYDLFYAGQRYLHVYSGRPQPES